jgi:hypothetical protein
MIDSALTLQHRRSVISGPIGLRLRCSALDSNRQHVLQRARLPE